MIEVLYHASYEVVSDPQHSTYTALRIGVCQWVVRTSAPCSHSTLSDHIDHSGERRRHEDVTP
jgi:hypothetical protein